MAIAGKISRQAGASMLLVCLALAGCRSTEQIAPSVNPAMAERFSASGLDVASLTRGREIYLTACTRCHVAEPIDEFSAARWRDKILPDMTRKAKLDPQETSELTAYVLAARESLERTAPAPR